MHKKRQNVLQASTHKLKSIAVQTFTFFRYA